MIGEGLKAPPHGLQPTGAPHSCFSCAPQGVGAGDAVRTLPVRLDDPEYLEKLGYETEVETSLPLGFRIRGSASHTPVRLHEGRGAPGSLSGGFMPAYVSDGNAASISSGVLSRV